MRPAGAALIIPRHPEAPEVRDQALGLGVDLASEPLALRRLVVAPGAGQLQPVLQLTQLAHPQLGRLLGPPGGALGVGRLVEPSGAPEVGGGARVVAGLAPGQRGPAPRPLGLEQACQGRMIVGVLGGTPGRGENGVAGAQASFVEREPRRPQSALRLTGPQPRLDGLGDVLVAGQPLRQVAVAPDCRLAVAQRAVAAGRLGQVAPSGPAQQGGRPGLEPELAGELRRAPPRPRLLEQIERPLAVAVFEVELGRAQVVAPAFRGAGHPLAPARGAEQPHQAPDRERGRQAVAGIAHRRLADGARESAVSPGLGAGDHPPHVDHRRDGQRQHDPGGGAARRHPGNHQGWWRGGHVLPGHPVIVPAAARRFERC
jgi:hypothetical protein